MRPPARQQGVQGKLLKLRRAVQPGARAPDATAEEESLTVEASSRRRPVAAAGALRPLIGKAKRRRNRRDAEARVPQLALDAVPGEADAAVRMPHAPARHAAHRGVGGVASAPGSTSAAAAKVRSSRSAAPSPSSRRSIIRLASAILAERVTLTAVRAGSRARRTRSGTVASRTRARHE